MTIPKLNPEKYVKLFNLKEDLFTCFHEINERQRMHLDNLSNMELIYVDGQFFFNKKDLDKYDLGLKEIGRIIERIKKRADEFFDFSKKFIRDYEEDSDDLMKQFKSLMQKWGAFLRIIDVVVYCEYFLNKKMADTLKRNNLDEKCIDILYAPLYESYNKRRHRDYVLLKMNKITKEEFLRRWGWSYSMVFNIKELTEDIIKENLDEIKEPEKELEKINKEEKNQKEKYNEFHKKLSPEMKELADLIQKMVFIRDYRLEKACHGVYNSAGLIKEIAKRLGLSYDELVHMTPPEVISKKIPSDLRQRIKRYCMFKGDVYTGKEADEIFDLFNKKTGLDMVKGTPAYHGYVKGIAKIIKKPDELTKLNKGEILVCDITTPDYIVGIKKAAAIVSNIGGITCHSAVVAREFKIPCVVGTGQATTTFNDGDMIEVDADKGIVRKVKKA